MPYTTAKGPKTKRLAEERLMRLIFDAGRGFDMSVMEQVRREVPDAWHMIEMDVDVVAPKEKITLYLDRAVVKCFRAMGTGYQARINRILETWVQMKMAELKEIELGFLEALEITRSERRVPDPEDWIEVQRRELAKDWAYQRGVEDGRAGFAKPAPKP
ncbi:MAG: BrnA antitoxin family protein [Pseudomonadota bacterium]